MDLDTYTFRFVMIGSRVMPDLKVTASSEQVGRDWAWMSLKTEEKVVCASIECIGISKSTAG
jgi:hypothetical protein